MLRAILSAMLVATLALAPTAAAHGCPPESESTLGVAGAVYLTATPGAWQESNGVPGLQTTAGSCTGDDGRDLAWTPDTQLA